MIHNIVKCDDFRKLSNIGIQWCGGEAGWDRIPDLQVYKATIFD